MPEDSPSFEILGLREVDAAHRALGIARNGAREGYYHHKNGKLEDALRMNLALVN